jgi:hypothetical protein
MQLLYQDWAFNPQSNLWFRQVDCLSGEFELFFVVFTEQTPGFLYCQYPIAPGNPPPFPGFGPPGCYWCACPIANLTFFSVLDVRFRFPTLEDCLPHFPDPGSIAAHYPPPFTEPMQPLNGVLPPGVQAPV